MMEPRREAKARHSASRGFLGASPRGGTARRYRVQSLHLRREKEVPAFHRRAGLIVLLQSLIETIAALDRSSR